MSQAGFDKIIKIKTTAGQGSTFTNIEGVSATLNFSGDMLDDTDFTSTGWRSRIRGLKEYEVQISAMYSPTSTSISKIRTALLNGAAIDFQYLPNGVNGFSGRGVVANFSHSGDVGGLESIDISLQSTQMTALTII